VSALRNRVRLPGVGDEVVFISDENQNFCEAPMGKVAFPQTMSYGLEILNLALSDIVCKVYALTATIRLRSGSNR
jgi:hypothetical protein